METLYFDLLGFVYHLALAVIVGGAIALGTAVAPAVFRAARTRSEGGRLFGAILARYDQLAIYALVLLVLASVLRFFAFEDTAVDARLVARWVALALLAAGVLYGAAWAGPLARALHRGTPDFDALPETSPARREFARLHRAASRAMRLVVLSGLVALFLS